MFTSHGVRSAVQSGGMRARWKKTVEGPVRKMMKKTTLTFRTHWPPRSGRTARDRRRTPQTPSRGHGAKLQRPGWCAGGAPTQHRGGGALAAGRERRCQFRRWGRGGQARPCKGSSLVCAALVLTTWRVGSRVPSDCRSASAQKTPAAKCAAKLWPGRSTASIVRDLSEQCRKYQARKSQ